MTEQLDPSKYYIVGDAGSFFFEGDNDGFDTPLEAELWARAQDTWPELPEYLSDGMSAAIVRGDQMNESEEYWGRTEAFGAEAFAGAPAVHNFAEDLGLVETKGD